jgi:ferredoxin-NADP reductase
VDELAVGDQLELRGPIGGCFVWSSDMGGPLLPVAGGSGICPLMAMLRHRPDRPARCRRGCCTRQARPRTLFIARSSSQLSRAAMAFKCFTRSRAIAPTEQPFSMVCGPTPLVEAVASTLVDMGHPADRVKTESFGPTAGV